MSKNSSVAGKTPWQAARSEGAAKRKAVYEARTPQEQLALLEDRPGSSARERKRLADRIGHEKKSDQ